MSKGLNRAKYENAILYFCHKLGGSVFGKKKLYKLLYYIDFDNFEYQESMESITGEEYRAWKMGPVPQNFSEILEKMKQDRKIESSEQYLGECYLPTVVFTAKTSFDEHIFSDDERFIMNRVLKKYGNLSGKQLEVLTHAEAPYIATEPNGKIEYELAFYRGTDFHDTMATA